MIKFPYIKPEISSEDKKRVLEVLSSDFLTQGPMLKNFELNISKKFKVKNTIVCNSGTSALHLIYSSLGLNKKNGLLN